MKSQFRPKNQALLLGAIALSLWNCSGESSGNDPEVLMNSYKSNVALHLEQINVPLLDSLVVDCYGADTLHLTKNVSTETIQLDLFPSEKWTFKAKLYANGALMQTGEVSTRVEAGETVDVSIQLHALSGFVYIQIPLGFGNPVGIAQGTMEISDGTKSYSYQAEIVDGNAIFKSQMLPLGAEYNLKLVLKDGEGKAIYQVEDKFLLDEKAPVPSLSLMALRGNVNLGILPAEEVNLNFMLNLPAAKRAPRNGDIVISEFFSSPLKSDSSQYEFIELFNGSIDTLELNGCTIGTTSQESKSWKITKASILPNEVVVLGDTSGKTPAAFRNTEMWGDLTNTQSSIVFQCGGTVMDSLYYSNKQDPSLTDVVPNSGTTTSNPNSSHLDIRKYASRNLGESWCLEPPSPGTVSNCQ